MRYVQECVFPWAVDDRWQKRWRLGQKRWRLGPMQEDEYQYDRGLPCRGRKLKNAGMQKVAARSDEGPAREALERAAGGAYLGAGREKCSMEVMHRRGSQGKWPDERLVEEVEAKALAVRFDFEGSLEE